MKLVHRLYIFIKKVLLGGALIIVVSALAIVIMSMRSEGGIAYLPEAARFILRTLWVPPESSKISRSQKLVTMTCLVSAPLMRSSMHDAYSVMNYNVTFLNHFSARLLFSEIFVDECYYVATHNPRPFIIDAGGNIGMATLYFKTLYPTAEMVVFEPGHQCFQILKKNIQVNNLANVRLVNKAVSNHEGTGVLFGGDGALGASLSGAAEHAELSSAIECTRLSLYITKPVDILKLDVEGAEHEVVEDLVSSGKLHFIQQMVLEYHHHAGSEQKDQLGSFLGILEKHGFGYQIKLCNRAHEAIGAQNLIIHAYNKTCKIS